MLGRTERLVADLLYAAGLSTAFADSPVFDPESLGRWQRDTVREVPIVTAACCSSRRATSIGSAGWTSASSSTARTRSSRSAPRAAGLRPVIVPEACDRARGRGLDRSPRSQDDDGARGEGDAPALGVVTLRARLGVGLLGRGVLLRAATRERSPDVATECGHTPGAIGSDWLPGYPAARALIFGRAA